MENRKISCWKACKWKDHFHTAYSPCSGNGFVTYWTSEDWPPPAFADSSSNRIANTVAHDAAMTDVRCIVEQWLTRSSTTTVYIRTQCTSSVEPWGTPIAYRRPCTDSLTFTIPDRPADRLSKCLACDSLR